MADLLARHWPDLAIPATVLVATVLLAGVLRRVLFRTLERWAARTSTDLDDILIRAFRTPFLMWSVIVGLSLATEVSLLPERATRFAGRLYLILWVVSFTFVVSRLVGDLAKHYGGRLGRNVQVTTLTQNLARWSVVVVGLLILLNLLGISIAPILAALGVGGLAVALALQETLANLFAGFYVTLAGQVRVGDYIRLDTGDEGYVKDISWRSTSIRALPNNLIIVPNSTLAQAIVTNFHLPEKKMAMRVEFGVAYESDLEHVERVVLEEAQGAVNAVPGLLAEPPPVVRFIPGFGESSLNLTLVCHVSEFVDQFLAQHELRKRLFGRFRQEGISIPFPVRNVILHSSPRQETSGGRG